MVSATTQDIIPERFHGKWAESADYCDIPGHEQNSIGPNEFGFFGSRGIVQEVRGDGGHAAATLSERHGVAPPAV